MAALITIGVILGSFVACDVIIPRVPVLDRWLSRLLDTDPFEVVSYPASEFEQRHPTQQS